MEPPAACLRSRTSSSSPLHTNGLRLECRARSPETTRSPMETYKLTVNGQQKEVTADPSTPLLWVLREELKMTGTKYGCGIAACGACTVHIGGQAARSCVLPVSLVNGRSIVTIEAMADDPVGRIVQNAWVDEDVVQCGYCQSGQI